MKKNLFYLFALVCSMSLFIACSDDDPDYSTAIDGEIVGNYKGTLNVTVQGQLLGKDIPQKISVAKAGPAAINLSLKDFSFMGIPVGDVELSNCELSKKGDTYTFTGVQKLDVQTLSCTINAAGTVANGQVKIDMDIAAVVNGESQQVKVVYEGKRLNGSESSEAKILSFAFDPSNEANAVVTEQPKLDEATNTFTFKVLDDATSEELKALVPTVKVSDKATYSVEGGTADFSQTVVYTVVAEDGTATTYKVIPPSKTSLMKFPLDEWETVKEGNYAEYWAPQPADQLASSNGGVKMVNGSANPVGYPVMVEEAGYKGKAAKLVTLDARGNALTAKNAPLASGSLFTGKFNFNFMTAITAPLKMTEFGIPYDKIPLSLKGVYKYKGGDNYVDGSDKNNIKDNLGIQDECAIQAVLYEAVGADAKDVILTGVDINDSDYRVAVARLEDGTDKAEWTAFNVPFEYLEGKAYDKEKTYKLAIICSSSKEGDKFKGAVGSTLIVDELEVLGE